MDEVVFRKYFISESRKNINKELIRKGEAIQVSDNEFSYAYTYRNKGLIIDSNAYYLFGGVIMYGPNREYIEIYHIKESGLFRIAKELGFQIAKKSASKK